MIADQFRILVVEDNEDDFFLLRRALDKNEISNPVHWVKDGIEAIEYLSGKGKFGDRSQYPVPKVVIVDLKMPRLSGLELLEWIKQQQPELSLLPVLVMSSSNLPEDISARIPIS